MLPDLSSSAMTAWADILSRIGEKNSRLYELLGRDSLARSLPRQSAGHTIIEELERERSRIARDLHAGAGQPLAGIKLNLEMLDNCATDLPPAGRDALLRLQTLAEQALQQVRAVSHSLHPPDWQGLSVSDALLQLVHSSGLSDRVEVDLNVSHLACEPSHPVKIALYRCAQECLSNVARHSGATRLSVSLTLAIPDTADPMIELRFEDNGHGFPPVPLKSKGIGLTAMREHATDLGGSCEIVSDSSGVRICVRLPLMAD